MRTVIAAAACTLTHSSHYLCVSVPALIAATAEIKEVSAQTQPGGRRRGGGQRMRACRSQKVGEVSTAEAKWTDFICQFCNTKRQHVRKSKKEKLGKLKFLTFLCKVDSV